jgi:hypothetical protein
LVHTLVQFNEQRAIDCQEIMRKLQRTDITTLDKLHQ